MKRLAAVLVAVVLVALAAWRPTTSQDNYEERLASLETRVAVLEGGSPTALPTLTPSTSGSGTIDILGLLIYGDPSGKSFVPVAANCTVHGPDATLIADTLPVRIADGAEVTTATTELLPGTAFPSPAVFADVDACVFPFRFRSVTIAPCYTVSFGFGRGNLPTVTVTHDELVAADFHLYVTAGEPVEIGPLLDLLPPIAR